MDIKPRKLEKVIVISPRRPGFYSQFTIHDPMSPEGPIIIATIIKNMLPKAQVMVIDESVTPLTSKSHLWKELYQADLIIISTMTCNENRGYWIVREAKKINLSVLCVAGGFGPSSNPRKALDHGINIVGMGEGIETIQELILAIGNGSKAENIQGIIWQEDEKLIKTPPRELIVDMDTVPFADWKLVVGWQKIKVRTITFTTGCPWDCTFCSVTNFYGGTYRHRSVNNAVDYTIWASEGHKSAWYNKKMSIFIGDDNIAGNPKWTEAFLDELGKRVSLNEISLSAQMRVGNCRNNSLMDQMKGKFDWLFFGCEDITKEGLESVNKGQGVEDIIFGIKKCHELGIKFAGMFIIGLDPHNKNSAMEMAKFALKHGVDAFVLFIRSPLPSTKDTKYLGESGRLIPHISTDFLDCQFATLKPLNMTPKDLQLSHIAAIQKFYNPWQAIGDRVFGRIDNSDLALRLAGAHYIKKGMPIVEEFIENYL